MKKLLLKFIGILIVFSICACATQTQEKIKLIDGNSRVSTAKTVNKTSHDHRLINKKYAPSASKNVALCACDKGTGSTGPRAS